MKNILAWIIGFGGLFLIGVVGGGGNTTDFDASQNGYEGIGRGVVQTIIFVITIALVIGIIKSNEKKEP